MLSGTISGSDLEGVLQAWGQKLSKAETDEFMRLASIGQTTQVNWKELIDKMLR